MSRRARSTAFAPAASVVDERSAPGIAPRLMFSATDKLGQDQFLVDHADAEVARPRGVIALTGFPGTSIDPSSAV
jgi:hypothetical protein